MPNAKSALSRPATLSFGIRHSAFGIDCEVTWSALTEPIRDVEANNPRSQDADGQVELRQAHRRAGREVGDVHEACAGPDVEYRVAVRQVIDVHGSLELVRSEAEHLTDSQIRRLQPRQRVRAARLRVEALAVRRL